MALESNLLAIVLTALGATPPTLLGLAALIQAVRNGNQAKDTAQRIADVHVSLDGRLKQLLESTNAESLAKGNLQGRMDERQDQSVRDDRQDIRQTVRDDRQIKQESRQDAKEERQGVERQVIRDRDDRWNISDDKRHASDKERNVSDDKREVSDDKREVSDDKREVSDDKRDESTKQSTRDDRQPPHAHKPKSRK